MVSQEYSKELLNRVGFPKKEVDEGKIVLLSERPIPVLEIQKENTEREETVFSRYQCVLLGRVLAAKKQYISVDGEYLEVIVYVAKPKIGWTKILIKRQDSGIGEEKYYSEEAVAGEELDELEKVVKFIKLLFGMGWDEISGSK